MTDSINIILDAELIDLAKRYPDRIFLSFTIDEMKQLLENPLLDSMVKMINFIKEKD